MTLLNDANKWIAALESGKYEQTSKQLKSITVNSFCCLGVLCEVEDNVMWRENVLVNSWSECDIEGKIAYHNDDYPPSTVLNKYRLDDKLDDILNDKKDEYHSWCRENKVDPAIHGDIKSHLAYLNDEEGLSFSQIAEFLRLFYIPFIEEDEE